MVQTAQQGHLAAARPEDRLLLSLTLLDVFRMGTSFSALILASRSSHARPVFWKRILGEEQG